MIKFNENSNAKFTYCLYGFILLARESIEKKSPIELLMAVVMYDDNKHEMFISHMHVFKITDSET